jgi:signal peptidase I
MEKTMKKKKILKVIGNIAFWLFLGLILIYTMTALFSEEDSNMRTVFGVSTLSVQSDSMEPTFKVGDLIFVKSNFEVEEIEVGDVITYRLMVNTDDGQVMIFNSHRVIQIIDVNGVLRFYTQGDKYAPDPFPVVQNDIVGVWTGGRLAGFGTFADSFIGFIKSSLGFFLFIVVPCFVFLVYEIFRFVKVMSEYNVQKSVGDKVKFQAEALALARQQIEAELRAKIEAESQKE